MVGMAKPALHPVVWRPPARPHRARVARSQVPLPPLRLLRLNGPGPEHVVADAEGRILTGLEDGRVLRVDPQDGGSETVAETGGRPAGLYLLPDGALLACDTERGLLRIDIERGTIDVLVAEVGGEPLRFCSNVVAATDGTVYFTESSRRFGFAHWLGDILEHSGTGRLMRLGRDGRVEVLLDGLQFANGVVLAPDESFVVVAETGAYRLTRLWLTGDRAGTSEPLVDDLPAFPDNLSLGPTGLIWVGMVAPRDPKVDLLHRTHPLLRRALWALPDRLRPGPRHTVWAMAVDLDGTVVHDLQGSHPEFRLVTAVCEHGGNLYLGSLTQKAVGVVELPAERAPNSGGR